MLLSVMLYCNVYDFCLTVPVTVHVTGVEPFNVPDAGEYVIPLPTAIGLL